MYIVLDGQCQKEIKHKAFEEDHHDDELTLLRHGDFFNMFAMWYNCPCAATITTLGRVTTLSISYDEWKDICEQEAYYSEPSLSRMPSIKANSRKGGHRSRASLKPMISDKFSHLKEQESATMKSIRYAMWIHLLKLFFLK